MIKGPANNFTWQTLPFDPQAITWQTLPFDPQAITAIDSGTLNIVYATHQGHLIDCKNGGARDITLALPDNSTVGTRNLTHIIDIYVRAGVGGGNVNVTSPTNEMQGVNPYIPITYEDTSLYIGNSTTTAGGVLVSVYSRAGKYIITGPIRNDVSEDLNTIDKRIPDNAIEYKKIERAFEWVDQAGSIEKAYGFENMALVYKTSTQLGSDNSEWVPTDLDYLFELQSGTEGTGPNARHNYELRFKPGAIKYKDIQLTDNLEDLLAINFVENPSSISNGVPLEPRLTRPWFEGDALDVANNPLFALNAGEVRMTIPRKRTSITRSITHILVKAGRLSGVDDTTTRTEAINAIQDHDNTYHEVIVPVSAAYVVNNNTISRRDGYDRYNVLFASGVSCAIEIRSNEDGTTDITAEANNGSTNNYNGTEWLAFYVVRGIGG